MEEIIGRIMSRIDELMGLMGQEGFIIYSDMRSADVLKPSSEIHRLIGKTHVSTVKRGDLEKFFLGYTEDAYLTAVLGRLDARASQLCGTT